MTADVVLGDCVDVMAAMDPESVDAVVTDPPYLISFMNRSWDTAASGQEMQRRHEKWAREAFRVLKPGGHLLAFGGSRTYHRLACAVEDAGFEIRDMIDTDSGPLYCDGGFLSWKYGSGFPKSLDVSKAIDKAAGAEREVIGQNPNHREAPDVEARWNNAVLSPDVTAPATQDAERWQGWGTALKPSHEPIVVARKPLVGTVAGNVLEYGTGALNIDGCRIGTSKDVPASASGVGSYGGNPNGQTAAHSGMDPSTGRWPANTILVHSDLCVRVGTRRVKSQAPTYRNDSPSENGYGSVTDRKSGTTIGHADADGMEQVDAWECVPQCPVRQLDEQSGERPGAVSNGRSGVTHEVYGVFGAQPQTPGRGDKGGASRFFATFQHSEPRFRYVAKASTRERGLGLPEGERNGHPCVKPVEVMRWLVRLVTPPGGTVVDPFCGSGTTGIACVLENKHFIGIEQDAEYARIARARIQHHAAQETQLALDAA